MTRLAPLPLMLGLVLTFCARPSPAASSAPPPGLPPLAGDSPLSLFPESDDLRGLYWDGFISAGRDIALSRSPSTVSGLGGRFRFSARRDAAAFYVVLTALKASGSSAGSQPPLYSQGSWIFKRSLVDGSFLQAKVFLRSDPGTFLRLYPDGDRTRLDLLLYGGVLVRNVPVPIPFERAAVAPLSDLVAWTGELVDWSLFSPRPGLYKAVRSLVTTIRNRLPGLRYVDDGALDASGRAVNIRDGSPQLGEPGLNCSGFAKWVVDGFYRPITGSLLDPETMASRQLGSRGGSASAPYEELLDPYFGLDWTRNLGKALYDAAYPERQHGLKEADVNSSPFALFAANPAEPVNGASQYTPYAAPDESAGYAARGLRALLYVLALRNPGDIYLASVSRSNGGELPELRRHYHVAVLVPYFDEDGTFRVAVFESDAETSLEALVSRTPDEMIHLVRLPVLPDFDPPQLPMAPGEASAPSMPISESPSLAGAP